MDKVFDFLKENKIQYCATVGLDGKPKVRPFQLMYTEGGRLYFCTGANKRVYRELEANPYVEISVSTMSRWLSISGRVEWVDGKDAKKRCIEANPLVKSIYKDENNPVLKVFRLAEAFAVIDDFSGNPPEVYKLN